MRILIAYRYFEPDTPPYASMLGELTTWFAEAGHEVEMITAQPSYKPSANIAKQPWRERRGNLTIRRLALLPEKGMGLAKVINSALFILRAYFIILFGKKRDLIWTATMPPVIQALFLSSAAKMRGAEFLYHMQDLHPEISNISDGKITQTKIFKILHKLDIRALNRTTKAIVISPDMADVLKDRGAKPEEIKVIRNFALGDERAQEFLSAKDKTRTGPMRFVFAGNIGLYQNLGSLVDAFAKLNPEDVQLVIVGEGRAKAGLIDQVEKQNIANVEFHDHMSTEAVFEFLCHQDVGVVCLSPGLYKYAFPSKIWTYIAADLPMLGLVEDDSNLKSFLDEHQLGMSLPWESSPDQLAKTISKLSQDVRQDVYNPAAKYELYHRDAARKHWLELMEEVGLKRGISLS